MEHLIIKHYYSNTFAEYLSDVSYSIFKDYRELYDSLINIYKELCEREELYFDEKGIIAYRCGSITTLGEFRIYSRPLPIYLEDVKEMLKND